jgi:hypothetical protein
MRALDSFRSHGYLSRRSAQVERPERKVRNGSSGCTRARSAPADREARRTQSCQLETSNESFEQIEKGSVDACLVFDLRYQNHQ